MIRLGIIGSGFGQIGLKPAFESVSSCKVVGICEHRDAWKRFLNKTPFDAVAVAVPPQAQYEIVKEALRLGLHVFAEKPLAANLRQAKVLYALSKKKRVVTGVDFMFPEIAEWQKVRELLDKKKYGKLKHVAVDWDWLSGDIRYSRSTWKSDLKAGGGALSFYFSHGLYYLEPFAGKIEKSKIEFTYPKIKLGDGESGFEMTLAFASGATGKIHLSSNTPNLIRHRLVFECERGTITLENKNAIVDGFSIKVRDARGTRTVRVKKDVGLSGEDERVKTVRKLAQRFVNACNKKKQMMPSFAEGLRVQELIDKIRRGA